jgi:uncharacterized protein (TIGR02246 family)
MSTPSPATIQAIEAIDARRVDATLAQDAAALREIFGDDLIYVHGSAVAESRDVFIERATTGFYVYRALTTQRRNYRELGDVVLVDGDVRIQVCVKGTDKDFVTRYLQVWARRDGRWQMISWQSTPVPAA